MNEAPEEPRVVRQQITINAQRALELGTKVSVVLAALGITGRTQRVCMPAADASTLAAQQWSGMMDSRGQPINKPVKFDGDVEILIRYLEEAPVDTRPFLVRPEAGVEVREPILAAR